MWKLMWNPDNLNTWCVAESGKVTWDTIGNHYGPKWGKTIIIEPGVGVEWGGGEVLRKILTGVCSPGFRNHTLSPKYLADPRVEDPR